MPPSLESPVPDEQPHSSPAPADASLAPEQRPAATAGPFPPDLAGVPYDEVLRSWPLQERGLAPAPAVPYEGQHWDWRAINAVPQIDPTAWVAPGVVLYGRVRLEARASVWFGCVLRGDQEWIEIGEETNIQDGSILHVEHGGYPCRIGSRVTLGHQAIVHGSTVGDGALIGIGAVVLSRCVIGEGALIAAGAVVMEGTIVPPHTLWAGCPAKPLRELNRAQRERLAGTYRHYVNNSIGHRAAFAATGEGDRD